MFLPNYSTKQYFNRQSTRKKVYLNKISKKENCPFGDKTWDFYFVILHNIFF